MQAGVAPENALVQEALLRRVFPLDVLRCPRCDGRMVVLAAINDPRVAQKILRHLGLPTAGPVCAPARAPPELDFGDDADFDDAEVDADPDFDDDIDDADIDADPDFLTD